MTEWGRERAAEFYGPLVVEGTGLLARFSTEELASMLRHLQEITELTDRHRNRLRS